MKTPKDICNEIYNEKWLLDAIQHYEFKIKSKAISTNILLDGVWVATVCDNIAKALRNLLNNATECVRNR